jgi:hypothetical protein
VSKDTEIFTKSNTYIVKQIGVWKPHYDHDAKGLGLMGKAKIGVIPGDWGHAPTWIGCCSAKEHSTARFTGSPFVVFSRSPITTAGKGGIFMKLIRGRAGPRHNET